MQTRVTTEAIYESATSVITCDHCHKEITAKPQAIFIGLQIPSVSKEIQPYALTKRIDICEKCIDRVLKNFPEDSIVGDFSGTIFTEKLPTTIISKSKPKNSEEPKIKQK